MNPTLTFKFPYPPSMNMIWRISPHGGNYLSDKAVAFYQKTTNIIRSTKHTPFTVHDRLELKLTLHRGDRRRFDISNTVKVVEDALVRANVMPDDSQIDVLYVERGEIEPHEGFCIVQLKKIEI